MGARVIRLAQKSDTGGFMAAARTMTWDLRYRPRDFIDIIAVVGGGALHVVRDPEGRAHRRILRPGDLLVSRPGDDVSLITGVHPAGLSLTFMSFPAADWYELAAIACLDPSSVTSPTPPVTRFDPGEDRGLLELFERAVECSRRGVTGRDVIRFWIEIIGHVFPESGTPTPAERWIPPWLTAAVDAMSEEANMRGGVRRMHELAHVSASHLSITTRRHFGQTPSALVAEIRLRHAALLLTTTDESIETISRRCGFASLSYFSTSFRRQHLLSPREYRARARGRLPRARNRI